MDSVTGSGRVVDNVVCGLLAGSSAASELSPKDFDDLWTYAQHHDVDVLIALILLRSKEFVLPALRQQAARRLAEAELRSLLRYRELCRLAASFAAAHVDVLVLKGAGLAHTVYPEPHFRPSRDTDLFIRREARDSAERALSACGYTRMREPDVEMARTQRQYVRRDGSGLNHFVDLHWRASNQRLFADALSFDDAWDSSIILPGVEPATRTLGLVDALLLACVHRVAHHQDAADLLWLWDIHLLAGHLTPDGWRVFVSRAEATQMRAVSLRGLKLARGRFGTILPAEVITRLELTGTSEPTARFIGANFRLLDLVQADLQAASWRYRATIVREHLFPSRAYMRKVYPRYPSLMLPLAYVHRIVSGAPKWFRRS